MTALCTGGTSSSKPDFSRYISITTGAAGFLLRNTGNIWAVGFGALIGLINYDLNEFCTTDPPPMPTITAADCLALLNPLGGSSYFVAQKKFQDLIANYAWPEYCQCDSGPQPSTPAAQPAPTDLPQVDPVSPLLPDPNLATPCFSYPSHIRPFDTGTSYPQAEEYGIQSGMTGINLMFTWPGTPVLPVVSVTWHVEWRDASHGTLQNETTRTIGAVDPLTIFYVIPPRAVWFVVWLDSHTNFNNNYELQWDVDGYCNNLRPGGDSQQCCPPDAGLLALLGNVQSLVSLIQRQAVPFAYVPGTVHAGLTGNGHFDVQGLIGVKLQVDSYGSAIGQLAGDPTEFYDVGWFAWGGPDGYSRRELITHSPQLSLPAAAGQYTSLGYSLGHDVEVTITELVRES